MRKYYLIGLLMLAVYFADSCTTPAQTISNKPWRYNNKRVKVRGKVVSTIHLDDLSLFTIKGGQAKLNVVTDDFLPVVGDNVKVKGTVIKDFYYQRDTILVIRENVKPSKKEDGSQFNKSVN